MNEDEVIIAMRATNRCCGRTDASMYSRVMRAHAAVDGSSGRTHAGMCFLGVAIICALSMVAACGGYAGPPDIEAARAGIRPEHHIVLAGQDGKSVLDLLREHTDEVTVEESSMGVLVTAIDEIDNGVEGRSWLYYVNDTAGIVAADRMPTVAGDTIEWLFVR